MNPPLPNATVPGGVYLCQVADRVSCGACCGLYNVADPSRKALEALLSRRSDHFVRVERTVEGILGFKNAVEALENPLRPYPDFHHCPYIGLIGPARNRVGCLLHPLAEGNGGIDFRGLSDYGGMACRIYFCPATRKLPARWKRILRAGADHWHGYGLLVTDRPWIEALFSELEGRLGHPIAVDGDDAGPVLRSAVGRIIDLKIHWPHRPHGRSTPCNYFFEDGNYPPHPVAYPPRAPRSRHHRLFRALQSAFADTDALKAAEGAIEDLLDDLLHAFSPAGKSTDADIRQKARIT